MHHQGIKRKRMGDSFNICCGFKASPKDGHYLKLKPRGGHGKRTDSIMLIQRNYMYHHDDHMGCQKWEP